MTIIWCVFLAVVGAASGSFVGVLVWRLKHNADLSEKLAAKKISSKKFAKDKLDWVRGRSICEHCRHSLGALDLVPVFSWLFLRGKCRYCHAKIGWTALLLELGLGAAFGLSFLFWPFGLATFWSGFLFGLWLIMLILLTALLVYDARWRLLPDRLMWPLIVLALVFAVVNYFFMARLSFGEFFATIGLGLLPVAGVYGVLWLVSRGRWVGLGDVKLGVAVGLLLNWKGALLVLSLANILGCLVVLPLLVMKKLKLTSQIALGPWLIVAMFVAVLWGEVIIDWLVSIYGMGRFGF